MTVKESKPIDQVPFEVTRRRLALGLLGGVVASAALQACEGNAQGADEGLEDEGPERLSTSSSALTAATGAVTSSALSTRVPPTGEKMVITTGYYADNDGGGDVFLVVAGSTAPANG